MSPFNLIHVVCYVNQLASTAAHADGVSIPRSFCSMFLALTLYKNVSVGDFPGTRQCNFEIVEEVAS